MAQESTQNSIDRSSILDANFRRAVSDNLLPQVTPLADVLLTHNDVLELFESQLISRHLDLQARELKRSNKTFYTIGSCGHEGMAAIARAFRVDDMAFLHYRDAAFMIERSRKKPEINIIEDMWLSLMAAKADPIAAGRHKVLGSLTLSIPPQTSTIASHLPKAVGAAAAIKRAQTLGIERPIPDDGVILASFGDASVNHAAALSAFNSAQWIAKKQLPLPLVFICEDNGLGISVPTPDDWVEEQFSNQPHLHYIKANGLDIVDLYRAAREAEHIARVEKRPVFLHVKCVRLLGHAGSDYELHYRNLKDIERDEAKDPLLYTAAILIQEKITTKEKALDLYDAVADRVRQVVDGIADARGLSTQEEVMASIIPPKNSKPIPKCPSKKFRQDAFKNKYKKLSEPLNLAQHINAALTDMMLQYPNTIVFGEDVARKGGVYRVTADLLDTFGPTRVFDSLLDETTILGQAIGHAHNGFIPIPEIQFLAYLHNAEDQLRGEAATLSFFSNGQFTNPMVIRIPSFAYQKGFGGHFHNDNSIAVLRDIPGLVIACPSKPSDASSMLRECVRLAYQEQRVVVFLEPIALYMMKGLHESGDQQWAEPYDNSNKAISIGEFATYGKGKDACIITFGNGHYLSQQAAKILKDQHNVNITIIDLRWLAPLNEEALLKAVKSFKQIVIVDEERKTGSLSEQLTTLFATQLNPVPKISICAGADSFIPLGDSWQHVLPSVKSIVELVVPLKQH